MKIMWDECGVSDELTLGTDVKTGKPYRMRLTCQKPLGHGGRHGNGPETIWNTEWPLLLSPTTPGATDE